ncbi:MAG: mechanosensitive ion channel family protein [Planctomycetes bacterium]|nr:mechanosensitive ion channel family protein [Planctomycetota bacterium]
MYRLFTNAIRSGGTRFLRTFSLLALSFALLAYSVPLRAGESLSSILGLPSQEKEPTESKTYIVHMPDAGATPTGAAQPAAVTPVPAANTAETVAAATASPSAENASPTPTVPTTPSPTPAEATPATAGATQQVVVTTAADAEAAAKAAEEAEQRRQREQERQQLLDEAHQLAETADRTVMESLPYPLNFLVGYHLFGVALWRYLLSVLIVGAALLLMWYLRKRVVDKQRMLDAKAKDNRWYMLLEVALLALRRPLRLVMVAVLLRIISSLVVTAYHPDVVWVSNLLLWLAAALYLYELVGLVDKVYGDRIFHAKDRLMQTVRPIALLLVRALIILFAAMHVYQSMTGQTMISVLAGLGIGGVALALASQETLKNLLGFASIALDKAFLVGDNVTIADYDGTVEHVGLRSTRLRGFDGTAIVIPNSTAINSDIVNKNRQPYMRREINLHLSPLNSYDKMVKAMELVEDALSEHQGKISGLPPVVRFVDFQPARFLIQAYFWYDANQPYFFDESSRINLEILKRFSGEGILFAER